MVFLENNSSSASQGLASSPYQNPLTQQQKERMELNKEIALARQRARRQSQEYQTKSQLNEVIEDTNTSNTMPFHTEFHEDPELLMDCSDQPFCHGCIPTGTTLAKQQVRVLQAIAKGQSVFVTGSAGTGKSFYLVL